MSKILVIDDNTNLREITQELLEMEGFEVYQAEDGLTGLELAKHNQPDLILCDVTMPNLDGYGVLTRLQQNDLTASIPFIFLTARTSKTEQRQGMSLGADDYITKPFSRDELLSAIKIRLNRRTLLKERFEKKLDTLRTSVARSLPHELNTPLSVILMSADTLQHDQLTPEENREIYRMIDNAAHRLQNLIEKFLLYSELEIARAAPEKWVNQEISITSDRQLRLIISEAAKFEAKQANRAGDLQLNLTELENKTFTLPISDKWFRKLIEEVVDNAFRYSPNGTPVKVIGYLKDKSLVVNISDRGRGMTAEQILNLGAYVQFDRKIYEQQGSGLGLTIASQMVELYGGHFHIESEINHGSRVTLSIPV